MHIRTFIFSYVHQMLLQVNHIVSKGVPVMIADRVSTKNAIDFIQNVEAAALAAANGQGNKAATTGG